MSRRLLAHLALALAGLALAIGGVWSAANPSVDCRGVEMRPGDVCHKNDFSQLDSAEVQTYEQRRAAARQSQPVLIVSGLVVTAFALHLAKGERTRGQVPAKA